MNEVADIRLVSTVLYMMQELLVVDTSLSTEMTQRKMSNPVHEKTLMEKSIVFQRLKKPDDNRNKMHH